MEDVYKNVNKDGMDTLVPEVLIISSINIINYIFSNVLALIKVLRPKLCFSLGYFPVAYN